MEETRLLEESERWRQRYYETWLYYSIYAATAWLFRGRRPPGLPPVSPAPVRPPINPVPVHP